MEVRESWFNSASPQPGACRAPSKNRASEFQFLIRRTADLRESHSVNRGHSCHHEGGEPQIHVCVLSWCSQGRGRRGLHQNRLHSQQLASGQAGAPGCGLNLQHKAECFPDGPFLPRSTESQASLRDWCPVGSSATALAVATDAVVCWAGAQGSGAGRSVRAAALGGHARPEREATTSEPGSCLPALVPCQASLPIMLIRSETHRSNHAEEHLILRLLSPRADSQARFTGILTHK